MKKYLQNLRLPLSIALLLIAYFYGLKWMILHTDPNQTMAAFLISVALLIAYLRTRYNDGRSN